jgi:hypothetical protein
MEASHLIAMPHDIMIHLCTLFLPPASVASLASTCTYLNTMLPDDNPIWSHHLNASFPQPSLVALKPLKHETPSGETRLHRFLQRLTASRHELQTVDGSYTFKGYTKDHHANASGEHRGEHNITNATASITISNRFFFAGSVETSDGSLRNKDGSFRNKSTTGTWEKGFFGGDKSSPLFFVQFQERLPTNRGFFIYDGILDATGTEIRGTVSWSFFPKKTAGEFCFKLVEASRI